MTEFVNLGQWKKLYKAKKDVFKDYVKAHDVKFENTESIVQLLDHLESE